MAFISLDELSPKEPVPGCFAKFIHSEHMTVASWEIGANTPFPEHSHPHEQIMLVYEGEFELTVGTETMVVRPGVVAVIPSGTSHSGRALTDCRAIDAFHPVREDYR
jgi:quercetin dioxygenase-like cupin family protein